MSREIGVENAESDARETYFRVVSFPFFPGNRENITFCKFGIIKRSRGPQLNQILYPIFGCFEKGS